MNITQLPIEIQELIIVNINDDTKLNLVCSLWNEICKKETIKLSGLNCICKLSLWYIIKCKSKIHHCICNIDKESVHYALRCRATSHPCICKNGELNHVTTCRANTHLCVCNIDMHFTTRCRSSKHITYL